jgi:hypothetical protein
MTQNVCAMDLAVEQIELTGKEAGGNLTATIDGEAISRSHLIAHIKAPGANVDCPKVAVWGMTPTQIKATGGRG